MHIHNHSESKYGWPLALELLGKDVTYHCPVEPNSEKLPPSKMQNSCRPRVCEGCGKTFTPPSNNANRMTSCMECRDDVRNQKRRAYRAKIKEADMTKEQKLMAAVKVEAESLCAKILKAMGPQKQVVAMNALYLAMQVVDMSLRSTETSNKGPI